MLEYIKDVAVIVIFTLVVLATIGFFILFSGIRMMKGNKPTGEEETE